MLSRVVPALLLLAGLLPAQAARASISSSRGHSRSLAQRVSAGAPIPLPAPWMKPEDLANAQRSARGSPSAFATDLCSTIAQKDIQGTREFRDTVGVKLWPMFINLARAAAVYPDSAAGLGQVLAKCNSMGGMAAEGVGYGVAYVYAKGWVESTGMTAMLESAYNSGGGCSAIANIMDVAAAVIKSRDVAQDELHIAIGSYSKKLQSCTPKDDQQRFRAYSFTGDAGSVRAKDARSMPTPTEPPAAATATGAGSGTGGSAQPAAAAAAITEERGKTATGATTSSSGSGRGASSGSAGNKFGIVFHMTQDG